jgi:pimeloyl-ACP methyl ester carboxylesterase
VYLRRATQKDSGAAIVLLPGIIMPAELRYEPLARELGNGVQTFTKELEVYDRALNRDVYSIDEEVIGLARAVDVAGIERFFLYGHSAGGAVSLAFALSHPDRLLGLALDEPATDFSADTRAAWAALLEPIGDLPESERQLAFLKTQVAPNVEIQVSSGPAPEWMADRPAGIEAFTTAFHAYRLPAPLSIFTGPVYFSFGTLTNPIWRHMRDRLASGFPNFTSEEYVGLHHLNTSHVAEPARVARALRTCWNI